VYITRNTTGLETSTPRAPVSRSGGHVSHARVLDLVSGLSAVRVDRSPYTPVSGPSDDTLSHTTHTHSPAPD